MDKKYMNEFVDRFLCWPLPESVCSDTCASKPGYPHRSGTTLLTADEARQMFTHVAMPMFDKIAALEALLEKWKENCSLIHKSSNFVCDATNKLLDENTKLKRVVEAAKLVIPLNHLRYCNYNMVSGDTGDFCTCGLMERREALAQLNEVTKDGSGT
jgi:hypothetical protein